VGVGLELLNVLIQVLDREEERASNLLRSLLL
jgi:hypothetical protein